MADVAPETLLARAIADILVAAGLGVWRKDGTAYAAGEHGLLIDQPMPTKLSTLTLITPLRPVRDSRTTVLYRAQLATRLVAEKQNMAGIRARADRIAALFDHREYTPPILGISFATEYSRLYFEPDSQNQVMVTQSFEFRGHTPSPNPGTTP
ncbi:hypothetical protein C1632_02460 [Microbacterium testaceum]|uniref:hypothetical protein n=1 Tax=Microbacterium testaceum TaxID=2033 RepID=UPI000CCFA804|nr:hypothetical protein [Microbacterium testaceum]PNW10642.1 hypothetical protein C1632_02460 [Microbacterium testaceum]